MITLAPGSIPQRFLRQNGTSRLSMDGREITVEAWAGDVTVASMREPKVVGHAGVLFATLHRAARTVAMNPALPPADST